MKYYVYENWTHEKAIIHRGDCSFCNYGKGIHGETSEKNGHWLKSFDNVLAARIAAQKTGRKQVKLCSFCERKKVSS